MTRMPRAIYDTTHNNCTCEAASSAHFTPIPSARTHVPMVVYLEHFFGGILHNFKCRPEPSFHFRKLFPEIMSALNNKYLCTLYIWMGGIFMLAHKSISEMRVWMVSAGTFATSYVHAKCEQTNFKPFLAYMRFEFALRCTLQIIIIIK